MTPAFITAHRLKGKIVLTLTGMNDLKVLKKMQVNEYDGPAQAAAGLKLFLEEIVLQDYCQPCHFRDVFEDEPSDCTHVPLGGEQK